MDKSNRKAVALDDGAPAADLHRVIRRVGVPRSFPRVGRPAARRTLPITGSPTRFTSPVRGSMTSCASGGACLSTTAS